MIALIHCVLSIALLIASGGLGLTALLVCMCLFYATMNYNYCCVLIYIIYTFVDAIQGIEPIGLWAQNKIQGDDRPTKTTLLAIVIAFEIFRPIAIYYTFQAYKEFKASEVEARGGQGGNGMNAGLLGR